MPVKRNCAMDALLTPAGNHPQAVHGIVNPPVYHASTALCRTIERMERAQKDRYDGLLLPVRPETMRVATAWSPGRPALRPHAGRGAVGDLIADLKHGFRRLAA